MKRRNFLKKVGFAAGVPLAFHGVPIKVMGASRVKELVSQSTNDRVLVLVQMHGGNDGLNTLVPLSNYDEYYSRRANIAIPYKVGRRTLIPLDSTVAQDQQVGLHPDMNDFKYLYDTARAAVFQGVSYENNNGSHFRGRDIWHMGGGADDYFSSGWVGRYLTTSYTPASYPDDFPTDEMPDPLALEMGNDVSLIFHQEGNIPTSISLSGSPSSLENQIEQLDGFEDEGVDRRGLPPSFLDDSPYGQEMNWILGLEDKSEIYIKRLAALYEAAPESNVEYPAYYPFNAPSGSKDNPLSNQLRLIARLLAGGVKTKVFLVRIGGFDTHASQVEDYDSTMGTHAALMYHLSSAMRAFQLDLRRRGLEDKVLSVTMSEFGRRVSSNGSFGTDHGTGGPVMLFGQGVNPGIYGSNPDVSLRNVALQFDYRQIFANILKDWMGVEQSVITNDIFFEDFISNGSYQPFDLIKDVLLSEKEAISRGYRLEAVYPNPATHYTQAKIFVNNYQQLSVRMISLEGVVVAQINRYVAPGYHHFTFTLDRMPAGIYFIKAKSEMLDETKKIIVRK